MFQPKSNYRCRERQPEESSHAKAGMRCNEKILQSLNPCFNDEDERNEARHDSGDDAINYILIRDPEMRPVVLIGNEVGDELHAQTDQSGENNYD